MVKCPAARLEGSSQSPLKQQLLSILFCGPPMLLFFLSVLHSRISSYLAVLGSVCLFNMPPFVLDSQSWLQLHPNHTIKEIYIIILV